MNPPLNNFIPLDAEEAALSASFEAGEWQTIRLSAIEKQAYIAAAQHTLQDLKQQISLKLNPLDMNLLKAKAQTMGISYQTILETLIHNYAIGKIKLEM